MYKCEYIYQVYVFICFFSLSFCYITGLSGSGISGSGSSSSSSGQTQSDQLKHLLRNWNYCIQLAHFMYQVCVGYWVSLSVSHSVSFSLSLSLLQPPLSLSLTHTQINSLPFIPGGIIGQTGTSRVGSRECSPLAGSGTRRRSSCRPSPAASVPGRDNAV